MQVLLGEHVGQLKENLTKVEELRMSPDYHFGPKLKRMFSDGPNLMVQPRLFTKQTYKSNQKPGAVHSAQKLVCLKQTFQTRNFRNF